MLYVARLLKLTRYSNRYLYLIYYLKPKPARSLPAAICRTRTRTNTGPYGTEANAAGRSGREGGRGRGKGIAMGDVTKCPCPSLRSGGAKPTASTAGSLVPHSDRQMGDTRRLGAPRKGLEVRPGSGEHVKDQQAAGESSVSAAIERGRTGTGKGVSVVGL